MKKRRQKDNGAFPYLICVCVSQTQIEKKRLTRSKLPPQVKKLVANRKYLRFSVYVESLILGITNICDLLRVVTNVTYGHLLGRNPYVSKRPKRQQRAFPLSLLSSALVGVLLDEQDCADNGHLYSEIL
jgi:hypothetical protein